MSPRSETLASGPAENYRAAWSVKRTQPTPEARGYEPLDIRHINGEWDLEDPNDRAQIGEIAEALRVALNTSTNSWAGGAR